MKIEISNEVKKETLRIIKKLPQIILPANKNEVFLNWYNKDLRFQDEIPKAFDRGYVFIENNFFEADNINIKKVAKTFNITYRQAENFILNFINTTKNTIVYFEFCDSNLKLNLYLNNELSNSLTINLSCTDSTKPNLPVTEEITNLALDPKCNFTTMFMRYCSILIQCCLWYMATTSKTTKYYRENKKEPFYYEKKEIINVKKNKFITTPIYDMSKIKRVKLDTLVKRRKGWTYSHSFQVRGHYRHYADGKIIFINSFIKGKEKEQMEQIITLSPKEE